MILLVELLTYPFVYALLLPAVVLTCLFASRKPKGKGKK